MHGHVRRIGNQVTGGIEDRAGKVEPFFHIDRVGGVRQRCPHLLSDRHEQVVEHLEHDRVGFSTHSVAGRQRDRPAQD